jgi:hypothetical protein
MDGPSTLLDTATGDLFIRGEKDKDGLRQWELYMTR